MGEGIVNKKLTLVTLLVMTLVLSFAAVPTVLTQPTDWNHLKKDTIGEPLDLDPAWAYDTASAELLMNVYEPLLWFNRTNTDSYVPRLATSWIGEIIDETSPEGFHWVNRWTFAIRDDAYFHSDGINDMPGEGVLMTPQDIEYSFERLLITDYSTGPAWMVFEPLFGGYWMGDVNQSIFDNGYGSLNATTGFNTLCDEAIDHAIESNATHIWFNLIMTYEPWLQIVAQQWGSILNKDWCVWHGDWPGNIDDSWVNYHDPLTSPLYSSDPSAPGPNLDAALGTGPYMLDYWDKGAGNAWSVVKNNAYWAGWSVPYHPPGWETGLRINGHVNRYTSNYIPEWNTRKLRFLAGESDFCDVPREYMDQVWGQPGIDMVWPLPQLECSAAFYNFLVNDSTTHCGVLQPNGTFHKNGAPPNMFNDTNTRLGFAHLFDYTKYMYAAYLNESISPVTPIVPGLSYYDSSIGKAEEPAINQRKEYGVTGEPANQIAYDLSLAASYLAAAWGGALWANGFTIDLVASAGSGITPSLRVAQIIQDNLNELNTLYGTHFHTNIVTMPWISYRLEWEARTLPYFIIGWIADYPDAHNFAHAFMHSEGAYSSLQGKKGVTEFPNDYCDSLVEAGIATLDPVLRQGNYTLLQQYYVDQCPGLMLAQPTGRHWERDWVEGWYYNPIYPGNYAYDMWNALSSWQEVDLAVTSISATTKMAIGQPVGDGQLCPCPGDIDVDVARLDTNNVLPTVLVIIGIGLRNATGYEQIVAVDTASLGLAGGGLDTYTATFGPEGIPMMPDPGNPITNGTYTVYAEIQVRSGFDYDPYQANNKMDGSTFTAETWLREDVNGDGYVELTDFFILSSAFGSYPGHPRWDPAADVNNDNIIELTDFFQVSSHFGEHYC